MAAGIALGPQGLNLLSSDIGVAYLLFVAGLEIDLEQFRQTCNRSATFGFGWNAAILLGSLFAPTTPSSTAPEKKDPSRDPFSLGLCQSINSYT